MDAYPELQNLTLEDKTNLQFYTNYFFGFGYPFVEKVIPSENDLLKVIHAVCYIKLPRLTIRLSQLGDRLGYKQCSAFLGRLYLGVEGPAYERDDVKGAFSMLKSQQYWELWCRLFSYNMSQSEMFVYGRYHDEITSWEDASPTWVKQLNKCKQVYDQKMVKVRASTLCLIWCLTLSKSCSKDVARMIAKLVFQSRFEPDIWEKE